MDFYGTLKTYCPKKFVWLGERRVIATHNEKYKYLAYEFAQKIKSMNILKSDYYSFNMDDRNIN